jgi:SPP1 family predicted phage head-tail adaptor
MTYRTGELDQRITFQERSSVPDGMGGDVVTWTNKGDAWAHVRPRGGNENTQFDRVNAEAAYLFVVRNRQDIKDSDRIMWESEPFNIQVRKQPKKRSLYLEIEGDRGVAQ